MFNKQLNNGYLYQNKKILKLIKLIDFIGYSLFNFSRKLSNCDLNGKKILVCNLAHLGDIVMSLRFIEVLKSEFKDIKIYFLCGSWSKEFLVNHPYIDGVIIYDDFLMNRNKISKVKKFFIWIKSFVKALYKIRKERFDISFELRAYLSTGHFLTFLGGIDERVGYKTGGFGFLLTKTEKWIEGEHEIEHYLRLLKDFLKEDYHKYLSYPNVDYMIEESKIRFKVNSEKYIVINIFSGEVRKKLDNYELWRKIIEYCSKKYDVYLTGTKDNYDILEDNIISKIKSDKVYNIAGKTNLNELINLLKNAELVITVETSIMHIVSSLNIPQIVIFHGYNDFNQFKVFGKNDFIIKRDICCSPCFFKIKCNNECLDINFDEIKEFLNGKI